MQIPHRRMPEPTPRESEPFSLGSPARTETNRRWGGHKLWPNARVIQIVTLRCT